MKRTREDKVCRIMNKNRKYEDKTEMELEGMEQMVGSSGTQCTVW